MKLTATLLTCGLLLRATCSFAENDPAFETPDTVFARDFVPAETLAGPLHTVQPLALNDGLRNIYFLETAGRLQEVAGTAALTERIREIYAIDKLRAVSKGDAFKKAIANAGKAKVQSAAKLVSDPFGTVKNVPRGASRFFGRIGEGMKGGSSNTEDGTLAGITGVTAAKAKLAAQLGVSPYSANEELQAELTNVARAMAGGGFVVDAATSMASGGAGAALTVVGANQTLMDTLANSTPEDLRIINRKKLLALGVKRELADEFLMHPWFSPWHETITTDALAQIGVNPTAFLTEAVKALTPDDAFYFQRLAQILARYKAEAAPLKAIRFDDGIVTALDRNGTLVVPVSLDYAVWTEGPARRAEHFAALDKRGEEIKALAVWVDGRFSERFARELKTRGIASREQALAASGNR